MCHFELTANSLGLQGHWNTGDPKINVADGTEYTISWINE
jgi:hypothetical protein